MLDAALGASSNTVEHKHLTTDTKVRECEENQVSVPHNMEGEILTANLPISKISKRETLSVSSVPGLKGFLPLLVLYMLTITTLA